MTEELRMDRNLALEAVRVTEAAALSASRQMGRGDERTADQVAVDAMRTALNSLAIDGTVVIGEGERDEAPMLYIGEKVGLGKQFEGTLSVDAALSYGVWKEQEGPMTNKENRTRFYISMTYLAPKLFQ